MWGKERDATYQRNLSHRRISPARPTFLGVHELPACDRARHNRRFSPRAVRWLDALALRRISEDLFRAVHWFATAKRTRLTGESVKPGVVLDLAKAFRNARSVLKHGEE